MPPWKLSSEAIEMILPGALREIMSRPASCESWKTAVSLIWMTFSQSARGTLTASSRRMMPALLTRMSTRPNLASTCLKRASGAAVSERSAANAAPA